MTYENSHNGIVPTSYLVSCKEIHDAYIGTYTSYGILAYQEETLILETIDDISVDKEWVLEICRRLLQKEVSILHFKDTILDLLVA